MKDPRELNRQRAATLGQEAVVIARTGKYPSPSGRTVDLRADVQAAVAGSVASPPNTRVPSPAPKGSRTTFEVTNETTLSAGRRLADAGHRVCALNFASAKNPGGGFLGGSPCRIRRVAGACSGRSERFGGATRSGVP